MSLPVRLTLEPMESEPVDQLPTGRGWQFEPKWDGFRCIAFRDGAKLALQSRNQRPLGRYFPELEAALRALPVARFVLDGEIIIREQSFDTLQLRLHPAASRIAQLAREHPATFVAFDLLADGDGRSLLQQPFAERRAQLEAFFRQVGGSRSLILSRATRSRPQALKWLRGVGHGLDGIVAKPLGESYRPGRRVMLKYKVWQTVDCVVAGLYWKSGTRLIDSLLLGLYDEEGLLHHVGRARVTKDAAAITKRVTPLIGGSGFTGRAPLGKSRWSERKREVVPVEPKLVVEVSADYITDQRFRHGARILRWRDDKEPRRCTLDQIDRRSRLRRTAREAGGAERRSAV
jgi:ATP-dependent DNA ligase